jgi:hypothetical protein
MNVNGGVFDLFLKMLEPLVRIMYCLICFFALVFEAFRDKTVNFMFDVFKYCIVSKHRDVVIKKILHNGFVFDFNFLICNVVNVLYEEILPILLTKIAKVGALCVFGKPVFENEVVPA